MQKSGFTLVELMIVVAIIAIIAAIAIPNLIRAKISANEASAIGTLRTIVIAEMQFKAAGARVSNGITQFGDLNSLATAIPQFIDSYIGVGNNTARAGYLFSFSLGANTVAPSFSLTADAASNKMGSRNFFIDHSGVLTWVPQSDGSAASSSPPIE